MGRKPLAPEVKAGRRWASLTKYAEKNSTCLAAEAWTRMQLHCGVLAHADDMILKQMKTSTLQSVAAYHERAWRHLRRKITGNTLLKPSMPCPRVLPKKLPKVKSNKPSPSSSPEGSNEDEDSEDEACVAAPPTPCTIFFEQAVQLCYPQGCNDQYCKGCRCICLVEGLGLLSYWCTRNHTAPGPPSVNHLKNSVPAMAIFNRANFLEMGHNNLQNCAHNGSTPTPSHVVSHPLVQSLLPHISSLLTALRDSLPDAATLEEWAALTDLKRLLVNSKVNDIAPRVSPLHVMQTVTNCKHAKVFTTDSAHANTFAAHCCVIPCDLEGDSDPMTPHENLEYTADLAVYKELNTRHCMCQHLHWDEHQELIC
ncbi:hypothetical protein B0H17DRAFT_1126534 [Mycena rosella]|uniref:Uncharacterized protein n=1 Tax=Mycena rosella TaxID=1033263 RepID=A0AAD7GTB8_MYCRO|nr:hypothetical protein B0H17DRAFT_1126534 [Mycena rosella]